MRKRGNPVSYFTPQTEDITSSDFCLLYHCTKWAKPKFTSCLKGRKVWFFDSSKADSLPVFLSSIPSCLLLTANLSVNLSASWTSVSLPVHVCSLQTWVSGWVQSWDGIWSGERGGTRHHWTSQPSCFSLQLFSYCVLLSQVCWKSCPPPQPLLYCCSLSFYSFSHAMQFGISSYLFVDCSNRGHLRPPTCHRHCLSSTKHKSSGRALPLHSWIWTHH